MASRRTRGGAGGVCTFCRILGGELAADIVLEDEACVAFLDHRPLFPGHCLVVPRRHHATLAEIPLASLGPLFAAARRLVQALETAVGAQGAFIALNDRVSQSVPHVHVHVVPRRRGDGLRGFFWPRQRYASDEERERVARALRAALGEPAEASVKASS